MLKILFLLDYPGIKIFNEGDNSIWVYFFFWGMAIKMTSDGDAKETIKFSSDQIEFTDTTDDKSLFRG